ncbi:hypothetical protein tb265_15290 [Gemmatimonadetes bacterium T265]|nr:hypothetical protein tb265_15290 [Gemmatimonadetes bacterium T265]
MGAIGVRGGAEWRFGRRAAWRGMAGRGRAAHGGGGALRVLNDARPMRRREGRSGVGRDADARFGPAPAVRQR